MIINKGPMITLSLDGIPAQIGRTSQDSTFLVVFGSERKPGDVYSKYSPLNPDDLPTEEDKSDFAFLYRKLKTFVDEGVLVGPWTEDHPAVFYWFQYIYNSSQEDLLSLIEKSDVNVVITHVGHDGNDNHVKQIKIDLGKWIDERTIFKPNPKIKEMEQQKLMEKERQIRFDKADRWDRKFKYFFLYPIFLGVIIAIIYSILVRQ